MKSEGYRQQIWWLKFTDGFVGFVDYSEYRGQYLPAALAALNTYRFAISAPPAPPAREYRPGSRNDCGWIVRWFRWRPGSMPDAMQRDLLDLHHISTAGYWRPHAAEELRSRRSRLSAITILDLSIVATRPIHCFPIWNYAPPPDNLLPGDAATGPAMVT